MKNIFTAFLLILIALLSTLCDSPADREEQTADVEETSVTEASGTEPEDEDPEIRNINAIYY